VYRLITLIISLLLINNCSNQISYSGKVFNEENIQKLDFKKKDSLLNKLGNPSYIDPITGKFFYYLEKNKKKSAFKKDIDYSYIFVFEFDKNEIITNTSVYDLKDNENIELVKDETGSTILKRGLLEKMFGGVGPRQEISTTP
tara:strand:+ start:507 stop:935 length:429 start_codon:yes stop_codon:yes gene_type:complete